MLEVVLVVELLELDEVVDKTVLELLDGLGDPVKRQEQADDTLDISNEH